MLNTKPWAALGRDLRCQPKKFGHAGHLWDGRLLVALHLCQCIFGHIGFPLRKPRSQIAQSNLVKIADFKNCIVWNAAEELDSGAGTYATSNNMYSVPPEIKDPVLLHAPTRSRSTALARSV